MADEKPNAALLRQMERTLENLADNIKDALLDWGVSEEGPGDSLDGGRPLPAVPREQFVLALRPDAELALRQAADLVNDLGPEGGPAAVERRIRRVFAELAGRVLAIGMQLRAEAEGASARPPDDPRSEWARRYRRMQSRRHGAGDLDETLPAGD